MGSAHHAGQGAAAKGGKVLEFDFRALPDDLRQGQPEADGVYTTQEISESTSKSVLWVRQRIREMLAAGLCKATTKKMRCIDDRVITVPAYRFFAVDMDKNANQGRGTT